MIVWTLKSTYRLNVLPPDERSTKNWNSGVYDLYDDNGFTEIDPTNFLFGYWGMRYVNLFLIENTHKKKSDNLSKTIFNN